MKTIAIIAALVATPALAVERPLVQDRSGPYAPKYSPTPEPRPAPVRGCYWVVSDWQTGADGMPLRLYRTGPGDLYCAPVKEDGGSDWPETERPPETKQPPVCE